MSSLTITVNESSEQELTMESSMKRQSLAISEHSLVKGTPKAIREWLMSSVQDSLANHSQSQESKEEKMTSGICGLQPSMSFAKYDPDTHSWRTSQVCLVTNTLDEYSETWPTSGMTLHGSAYLRQKRALHTSETDYGLWPTPTVATAEKEVIGSQKGNNLVAFAKMFPTPSATDYKGAPSLKSVQKRARESSRGVRLGEYLAKEMNMEVGGQLNPTWVEWLMGWPLGWTDLNPLEMGKFREWQQQHGNYSHE